MQCFWQFRDQKQDEMCILWLILNPKMSLKMAHKPLSENDENYLKISEWRPKLSCNNSFFIRGSLFIWLHCISNIFVPSDRSSGKIYPDFSNVYVLLRENNNQYRCVDSTHRYSISSVPLCRFFYPAVLIFFIVYTAVFS